MYFLQVDGHGEGVSRCNLARHDFEARLDCRIRVASGIDNRSYIITHGSYSQVGVQVLFLEANLSIVVSIDCGSVLRIEQVRILEGLHR